MSLMIYFTYAAVYLTFPYLLYALRKPSDWCDGLRFGFGYGYEGRADDADSAAAGATANTTIAGDTRRTDKPLVDPIADAIFIVNDSAMS